jgi:hypothetical protein
VSFFDDDDFDEPTHVADAEPRRGDGGTRRANPLDALRARAGRGREDRGAARPARPAPAGPGSVDPRTARQRQMVALGILIVVLVLLVLAVSSCVNNGRTSALKDYSRDVTAVLQESRDDVSVPMFRALASGEDANTVQSALNGLRAKAEDQADRAKGFSEPGDDDGKAAQHDLELAMNLRARAVRVIAAQLPAAKGDAGTSEPAISQIAGQIQAFLASDVIVLQRTKPLIDEALAAKDVSGADVIAPRTVTNVTLLDPDVITSTLAGNASTGSSAGASTSGTPRDRSGEDPATPGTHGTSLGTVTFGDTALTAGADATVTGRALTVQVENGGDTAETNVEVGATFTPSGGTAASAKQTVASIDQGETAEVRITLPATVKSGQAGELKVTIGGVPGEENMDNNTATYTVTIGG